MTTPTNSIPPGARPGKRFSKARFAAFAKALRVAIAGRHVCEMAPKRMKSGKLGWFSPGRMHITIGGVQVPCQLNVSLVIMGSDKFPDRVPEDAEDLPADGSSPIVPVEDPSFPTPGTPEWGIMNQERGTLIKKRISGKITDEERKRLDYLQDESLKALEFTFPR